MILDSGRPWLRRVSACTSAAATTVIALAAIDGISRQVLRRPLALALGFNESLPGEYSVGAAVVAVAILSLTWTRRRIDRFVVLGLVLGCVAGLAAQRTLGARLQSDGLRYYAFARSIAFDHDVNLMNDYVAIGLGEDREWLTPTRTGHAPSPFSVGPAVAWLPAIAGAHGAAHALNAAGVPVATDGTSFPYRQAVCIASLVYALLGFWFCYRLACVFSSKPAAALAMASMATASFMVWYAVKEPSMSHAVSMCAVAALLFAWAVTRGSRSLAQWALLGVLGGLSMTMRWQNVVFLLLPASDLVIDAWAAGSKGRLAAFRSAAVFGVAALAGFLPQLLTWQAMYGAPFGVSPLSPKMLWSDPAIVGVLWSSQNGLFSTSPIAIPAVLGLLVVVRREPKVGWTALTAIALAIYINASVGDWGGGAAYGPRRFDGAVPVFVVGLAAAVEWLSAYVSRRPLVAVATLLLAFVAWNATFMAVMLTGRHTLSTGRSFSSVSAEQATRLHGWIGHPFSYPASLWFALRNRVSPSRFDTLFFAFLGEPERPYGKVDIGGSDADYLLDGWHGVETDPDGTTWRWTAEESGVLVPLDHPAPLLLQARVIPFTSPASPVALVGAVVNGRAFGPVQMAPGGWQRVEIPVPASAWTPGVNRVVWRWLSAAVPAEVGAGADTRRLGARVDFVRVQVADAAASRPVR